MNINSGKILFLGFLIYLLCVSNPLMGQDTYYPSKTWRYSSPALRNMNGEKLDQLTGFLDSYYSDALLIIKDGFIVKEKYWGEFSPKSYHDIASCTKSFTSATIGYAIAEGKIVGVEQYISDFFPQVQDPEIRIKHALTMTLPKKCKRNVKATSNWLTAALECPLASRPGEVFQYNDIAPMIAGGVLQKAVGSSIESYFEKNIAEAIGMDKVYWWSDPAGNTAPMGLAKSTIYDCARIGYLYLNKGNWQGKQVLPEKWIAHTSLGTKANPHYGFFWWNIHDRVAVPHDTYYAYGRWGQFIVIIPSLDIVMVYFSNGRKALPPEGAKGDAWFLLEDQIHPVFGKIETEQRSDANTKLKPDNPHLNMLPLLVDKLVESCW